MKTNGTERARRRNGALALAAAQAAALMLSACDKDATASQKAPAAVAQVKGFTDSAIQGRVTFTQQNGTLIVHADIGGLKAGSVYAIHVHEKGNCAAPDSAGGHFHTGAETHGNPFDPDGMHHDGDLPNLQVDAQGVGHVEIRTTALQVTAGPLDAVGRSVIVHAGADDYASQPSGNSGARIACGIITAE